MPALPAPGIFGKFPNRGDFITLRLPRSFVGSWDQWLQSSIQSSKELLGPRWHDTYLVSPAWRFLLTAGVAGNESWAGIVLPSVDRVGRYFPLTIASCVDSMTNPLDLYTPAGDAWFASIESAARYVLAEDFDIDIFESRLESAGAAADAMIDRAPTRSIRGAGEVARHWAFNDVDQQSSGMILPALLKRMLDARYRAYSLWWHTGGHGMPSAFAVSEALPSARAFVALLDGQWDAWGWESTGVLRTNLAARVESAPTAVPVSVPPVNAATEATAVSAVADPLLDISAVADPLLDIIDATAETGIDALIPDDADLDVSPGHGSAAISDMPEPPVEVTDINDLLAIPSEEKMTNSGSVEIADAWNATAEKMPEPAQALQPNQTGTMSVLDILNAGPLDSRSAEEIAEDEAADSLEIPDPLGMSNASADFGEISDLQTEPPEAGGAAEGDDDATQPGRPFMTRPTDGAND